MKVNILTSTKDMSREEWLDYRRKGIGGSDAAAILGLNPYSSAISVYMDKLGLSPAIDENEAMWLGNTLEPAVADRFETETGLKVQRRNQLYQHPDHAFMLANIDRWIIGRNAGLEIKTTSMMNKTDFSSGTIPPSYYCQCLHYMAVTGADEWFLAVLVVGKGFHILHVQRDQNEIDALIEAEKKFWTEHIEKQIPPPPDGSEAADDMLSHLYPSGRGDGVLVPLYGKEDKLARILELDKTIKELESTKDAIKQEIQLEIGEADGAKLSGFTVFWKSVSKSSIDSKLLKSENPEIYNKYLRNSSYRRFEIKAEKGE